MQPNGNVIVDTICRTAKLGTTITGATENGDVTVIEAEPVEPINECPTCGQPGVFRDHVIRSLVDLPIVGHPTTSCAPSTLPVHQQALLAEDLPCWPCLRARQFKDHGPGDPLDPATTLPKSDERCRCTQVIRPGVGYEVSQVLFRLMKPVFETTYGAQRTPMPKLPQHRLPHQTHDSGIHTLNPHACSTIALTFAIGSGLAAVASLMYCAAYPQVSPMMGAMLGLKAFVAAVLGGIGSIPGAMIGGLAIGLIESLTKAYIGTITAGIITSAFSDAIVFAILIIVLLVKPSGIMGKNEGEKV